MARRRNVQRSGNRPQRIMAVRQVPDSDGTRGLKVERMIAAVKESQGMTRVVIRGVVTLNTSLTGFVFLTDFGRIRLEDDFQAMISQYQTYKVAGVKYECYDHAPGIYSPAVFGTYHTAVEGANPPSSYAQVIDTSDAEEIAPGTGKIIKYWYPTGPSEQSFYRVDGSNNFGGLAIAIPTGPDNQPKFSITFAAVVDFRARV